MSQLDQTHALVVLSGGQDSTTCLYDAFENFEKVSAVTFDYNQTHAVELKAAQRVWALAARHMPPAMVGEHKMVTVGPILQSTSPLVSDAPLEQYANYHSLPGGLEKTFVPMRNQLFLTLAANYAVACGAGVIVTGVCQEDFGGYPDCRRVFIDALETTTCLSLGVDPGTLTISTPLMYMTKAASVAYAYAMGAEAALAFSHTGYDGKYPPTGHDHATLLRAKGFAEAGLADPLVVRAYTDGLMNLPSYVSFREAEVLQLKIAVAATYLGSLGLLPILGPDKA